MGTGEGFISWGPGYVISMPSPRLYLEVSGDPLKNGGPKQFSRGFWTLYAI